jgi:multiple sugar transport system permease protein
VRTERASRWRHLAAAAAATLFVLPLIVMLAGSLREPGLPPPRTPELLSWPPSVEGYAQGTDLIDLGRLSANSIVVAMMAVALTVLVASSGGFALARLPVRPARWLVGASLAALMVPLTALLVGRFTIFAGLQLTDTFVPLVAPGLIATSPLYLLVFYWSFRRLPAELFEAARLEGATPIVTWWRVGMPQVWPVTVAVASLAFVISWGDFLAPLIYLFDARLYTLPLGMRALAQLDPTQAPILLAAAVIATVPVVVAFLVGQRALAREADEL